MIIINTVVKYKPPSDKNSALESVIEEVPTFLSKIKVQIQEKEKYHIRILHE